MYLHVTMFALPSKLILLYGFCIEPVSYMYLVSLVTVMCSLSFSLQYFAKDRKIRFRLRMAIKHSEIFRQPRQCPSGICTGSSGVSLLSSESLLWGPATVAGSSLRQTGNWLL